MNSSGFKGHARQGSSARGRRGREGAAARPRGAWTQRRAPPSGADRTSPTRGPASPASSASSAVPTEPSSSAGTKGDPWVPVSPAAAQGLLVSVALKSKESFQGHLRAVDADGTLVLAVEGDSRTVPAKDVEQVSARASARAGALRGSDSAGAGSAGAGSAGGPKFRTDTDISGAKTVIKERELERWQDDGPDVGALADDFDTVRLDPTWDQFAANKAKFGVESTYDERFYTTEIDSSHPEYADRARRANKIAQEIMKQSHDGNVHLAEERGIDIDDSGLDEEDKYSGVARQAAAAASSSRPPSAPSADFSKFVAGEAQAADANPRYYEREKYDRMSDLKQFSQEYKISSPVPPDLVPILGKRSQQVPLPGPGSVSPVPPGPHGAPPGPPGPHGAPPGPPGPPGPHGPPGPGMMPMPVMGMPMMHPMHTPSPGPHIPSPAHGASPAHMSPAHVSPGATASPSPAPAPKKPVRKFNFSAAAAKSSAFKPVSATPPAASPGANARVASPGSAGVRIPVPGSAPGSAPVSAPSPLAGAGPSSASPVAAGASPQPPSEPRAVKGKFDFLARLTEKKDVPPPFVTPPTWSATSAENVRFADQFAPPLPVPVPMMPYGFYGYAPPPMYVYDE